MNKKEINESWVQLATLSEIIKFMLGEFMLFENLTYQNYIKKFDGQRIFSDKRSLQNKDDLVTQFLSAVDSLSARDFDAYNKKASIYSFALFPKEVFEEWCEKRRVMSCNYMLELNVPSFNRRTDLGIALKQRIKEWRDFAVYLESA